MPRAISSIMPGLRALISLTAPVRNGEPPQTYITVPSTGATQPSQLVWRLGDISNAAMALPNLLALALLSGVVFKLARGDRTAGPTHTADTPEEPEEY